MKKRAFKSDEDHSYYGRSWWQVSAKRIGCIIVVILILAVGLPFGYKKLFAPTRAITVLDDKDSTKEEKLKALRLIRKTKFPLAHDVVELRLKDENEDLAVRGEAVKTIAVFGARGQKAMRKVFDSQAPTELKLEILNHFDGNDQNTRDLVELEAKSPTDKELGEECRKWLEMRPE
ncbi:MAG: hypothetical protein ACYS8W_08280 [Planctomycetota bacterium]|jgi:hypothetical protein